MPSADGWREARSGGHEAAAPWALRPPAEQGPFGPPAVGPGSRQGGGGLISRRAARSCSGGMGSGLAMGEAAAAAAAPGNTAEGPAPAS